MKFSFIELLLLFISLYLLFTVFKLDGRIKGLKYTIDRISKQLNVPENPINKELRELLKQGEDVKAVKIVRETLGLSLIEAKQYVDALDHSEGT